MSIVSVITATTKIRFLLSDFSFEKFEIRVLKQFQNKPENVVAGNDILQ